ncbi:deoxynucleoside kinase [Bacteroidota bacterium]
MNYNYIAIEGNIGAGKTSLATKMAVQFNGKLILERFEENEFLPKFYKDPSKYAFPLELSFLAARYQQLKEDLPEQDLFKTFTISDYLFDKSVIFARKTLPDDEFALFVKLFRIIKASLPKPDLIVYLYSPITKLLQNIQKRGRIYEQSIEEHYLSMIQKSYIDYFKQLPDLKILVFKTDNLDFVNKQKDYSKLIDQITEDYSIGIHMVDV